MQFEVRTGLCEILTEKDSLEHFVELGE
jgi:hypothetical protein